MQSERFARRGFDRFLEDDPAPLERADRRQAEPRARAGLSCREGVPAVKACGIAPGAHGASRQWHVPSRCRRLLGAAVRRSCRSDWCCRADARVWVIVIVRPSSEILRAALISAAPPRRASETRAPSGRMNSTIASTRPLSSELYRTPVPAHPLSSASVVSPLASSVSM